MAVAVQQGIEHPAAIRDCTSVRSWFIQAMWMGLWGGVRGQGNSDGPVGSVYPVREVSSSTMMYSHICDMTAASALQERTHNSLNGSKAYLKGLSSIRFKSSQWNVEITRSVEIMSNAIHTYIYTLTHKGMYTCSRICTCNQEATKKFSLTFFYSFPEKWFSCRY